MNLLYAEVIDIFDRDKIRMARIRAKGALKDIPLLADAEYGLQHVFDGLGRIFLELDRHRDKVRASERSDHPNAQGGRRIQEAIIKVVLHRL